MCGLIHVGVLYGRMFWLAMALRACPMPKVSRCHVSCVTADPLSMAWSDSDNESLDALIPQMKKGVSSKSGSF